MYVLLALATAFVIGLLLLINMIGKNKMPSKAKRGAELVALRAEVDQLITTPLVRLDRNELELFSLGQEKRVQKTGVGKTNKGIFTTIFQEPIVAYAFKRYMGKGENSLLYARTAEHEYVYWTANDKTTLSIDGKDVGTIDGKVLYGAQSGKEIARLATKSDQNLLPIRVGNREVGSLKERETSTIKGISSKALEFMPDDLDDREELLLISLATQELVLRDL